MDHIPRHIPEKGGPTSLCNIYAAGMAGNLYVDDVKIYSLKPFVDTPTLKRHTDFTQTSFKASWGPVDGADRYFLSVWSINEEGEREFVLEDKEIAGATSCEVNGVSETTTYFYDVRAAKGEQMSLLPLPYEVFDIVSPEMMPAEQGSDERTFISRVKPLEAAKRLQLLRNDRAHCQDRRPVRDHRRAVHRMEAPQHRDRAAGMDNREPL